MMFIIGHQGRLERPQNWRNDPVWETLGEHRVCPQGSAWALIRGTTRGVTPGCSTQATGRGCPLRSYRCCAGARPCLSHSGRCPVSSSMLSRSSWLSLST